MVTVEQSASPTEPVALGKVWRAGALAAVGAAAANAGVYRIASAVGAISSGVLVPALHQPITLPLVVLGSVMGALGATATLALLRLVTAHPLRAFLPIAAIALVLSCAGPFAVPDAPPGFYGTLLAMHVVAAAVIVGVLTVLVRAR